MHVGMCCTPVSPPPLRLLPACQLLTWAPPPLLFHLPQEKEMATSGISAAATEAPTVELPEGANSLSLLARGLAAAGITADKFKAVGAA